MFQTSRQESHYTEVFAIDSDSNIINRVSDKPKINPISISLAAKKLNADHGCIPLSAKPKMPQEKKPKKIRHNKTQ